MKIIFIDILYKRKDRKKNNCETANILYEIYKIKI